jgi:lauroyl/myristoyl acyltransferase
LDLLREHHQHRELQFLQFLREWRPGGWRPEIEVEGGEHLKRAHRGGLGVVLWVAPFVSSNLIAKKAISGLGVELLHLGSTFHGPTWSHFGRRFVNRFEVSIENRYLTRRITWSHDSRLAALRQTRKALEAGATVSIGMGTAASQLLRLPLFNGHIDLATGPAGLAAATGAVLLPVFTYRLAAGSFRVEIAAALDPGEGEASSRRQAADAMSRRGHEILIRRIRSRPRDFREWLEAAATVPS